jgi:hypothetical protein
MMKKIAIITSFLLFVLSAQGQSKKEVKTGKIKSITSWETYTKKGVEATYKESYEEFNANGNTIFRVDYTKKGIVKHKETAKFDANGLKTDETIYDVNLNVNVKKSFQYNGKVKTTCLEYDEAGKLIGKITYVYDANGNRIGENNSDALGNQVSTSTEEYNKAGKKIAMTETGKDSKILHKETAAYNVAGKKTEMTEFDLKENKNIKVTYKYNAFDDKSEECEYNANTGALMQKIAYAYNANGDKIAETYSNAEGACVMKITFTYNSKKLKETKVTSTCGGEIISSKKYAYEYF